MHVKMKRDRMGRGVCVCWISREVSPTALRWGGVDGDVPAHLVKLSFDLSREF